jgi:hypothetical protein
MINKTFVVTFENLNDEVDIMTITGEDRLDAEAAFWEVTQEENMVVKDIVSINEFTNDDEADGYIDWWYDRHS